MLTYRRGLDGFHGFSDNGRVLFLFFHICWGLFLVPLFCWNYRRGRRGELFSRFPRLGMLSGVTLVN